MRSPFARVLVAAVTFCALSAPPAGAGTKIFSPLDQRVLEQTTLIPAAASVTAYTAPSNARVVLTRFCGNGCVHCEGETVGKSAFEASNGGCAVHPQGLELPPGETVRCTNTCKTMGAALFSGTLNP